MTLYWATSQQPLYCRFPYFSYKTMVSPFLSSTVPLEIYHAVDGSSMRFWFGALTMIWWLKFPSFRC